jgi:imidazole glycerol-phosphate synthase subunit HisF
MKKNRLIPVLLLRNGWLVQSKGFKRYQNLGCPTTAVKRFSEWGSDELIFLDISKSDTYDMRRDDLGSANRQSFLEIIEDVAKVTFMPLTVGGKIRSLSDIETRLRLGADKVSVNTAPLENPNFVQEAAKVFGSQCIVVSLDVKQTPEGLRIFGEGGQHNTERLPLEWARQMASSGAGEILLNSIDRDGRQVGYDLKLLSEVSSGVSIPVIACGGAGEWFHFSEALEQTNVDAVAAANIFHYRDQSVYLAKKHLFEKGLNVRNPKLMEVSP